MLEAEPLLARHWWPDGASLDLFADEAASAAAIRAFAGPREAEGFRAFSRDARRLYEAFEGPVMLSPKPDMGGILRAIARDPGLARHVAPGRTLSGALGAYFRDPRLRQLFGRYATYVGGSPFRTAGLLMLIWEAESRGVWRVRGGMHALARAVADLAGARGAVFRYGAPVARIATAEGRVAGVELGDGERIAADTVVYNGDPAALAAGHLGREAARGLAPVARAPRALSAYVWAFAATARGRALAHHNGCFNADHRAEFDAIARGAMPDDATLYICAQDRGGGAAPDGPERFEIIMNGPAAAPGAPPQDEEVERCRTTTFDTLERMGLTLSPRPGPEALTTPRGFAARFPGSGGSLYGQSPHGAMAAFARPTCRAATRGLFLAGGGVHRS